MKYLYWSSNEGMKLSFALGFLLSHGERVSRSGSELSSKLFETVVFDLDLTIRVCSRERERERERAAPMIGISRLSYQRRSITTLKLIDRMSIDYYAFCVGLKWGKF